MDKIKGYERYSIDRLGNIYGIAGKLLKPSIDRGGYQVVWLRDGGKNKPFLVHRLVALQYIPQIDRYVNHINGNKMDNRVENLEWCSAKHNAQHRDNMYPHMYDKFKQPVRCIETGEVFESKSAAAKKYNGAISNLSQSIKNGGIFRGYHFEIINK